MTLKAYAKDWVDIGVAIWALGVSIGMLEGPYKDSKKIVESNNPLSDALHYSLFQLIAIGYLEIDHEEMQIRINPSFDYSLSRKHSDEVNEAIYEAVSAAYLHSGRDSKLENALFTVVEKLDPCLADVLKRSPSIAFDIAEKRLNDQGD